MNSNVTAFLSLEKLLKNTVSRQAIGNDYASYFWPLLYDFLPYVNK